MKKNLIKQLVLIQGIGQSLSRLFIIALSFFDDGFSTELG